MCSYCCDFAMHFSSKYKPTCVILLRLSRHPANSEGFQVKDYNLPKTNKNGKEREKKKESLLHTLVSSVSGKFGLNADV